MNRRATFAGLLVLLSLTALAQQYLVISADQFVPLAAKLAEWKTRKGVPAVVVPVSQIGNNPTAIQSYIRNAYNNWPVRPEFVLLLGGPGLVVPYTNTTDCNYGDMTGGYQMEIAVGRLPATTLAECSTMVAKVLAYEKPNFGVGDTGWYLRGTSVVREDNPPDPYYQPDSRLVRGFWTSSGYTLAESLMNTWGHGSADVTNSANNGRAFITYRGQGVSTWWSPFNTINPFAWTNGHMMPVVVGATCATVTLANGESMYGDKFVRAGTVAGLGGAIAYFGTTSSGSSISGQRGAVYRGFFTALYTEKVEELGTATLRGRRWVDSLYPGQSSRYLEWNLLGDPELSVWTGMPRRLAVGHDTVLPLAPQNLMVTVRSGGAAVAGARVCVMMDSTVYAVGRTDGLGQVSLGISPVHIGTLQVTVTGRNLLPYEGTARVIVSGRPWLVLAGQLLDEVVGNHDHVLNPGERVRLTLSLQNLGSASAVGVQSVFRCRAAGVTVYDSVSSYGTILPDSVVAGDPVEFAVDTTLREGQSVAGTLVVRAGTGDSWQLPLSVSIRSGVVRFAAAVLNDSPPAGNGNGRLGSSESGRLRLVIRNVGGGPLEGLWLVLRSLDTSVVVTDSVAFYGRIAAGDSLAGLIDQFGITAAPFKPPTTPAGFRVMVSASGGTYQYSDTFSFTIPGEQSVSGEPTGPDSYGYWCYDNTDSASGRAPVYSWLELAPPGPGELLPAVSDSDAVVRTFPLPFRFQFYGQSDNFISICSNGFLALGYTTYRSGTNRPIPDPAGPPLLISPFWDDLNPDENSNGYGSAYQYYDSTNHRWIVEFCDFAHYNQPNIREKFQAILYDPAYWPTPTGDGDIVFLYSRVALGSSCTVGIENQNQTVGIQYLYNNNYDPAAAWLGAGRAIRFTTLPPVGRERPWLVLSGVTFSDSPYGNGNGLLEAGETLTVRLTVRNRGAAAANGTQLRLRSLEPDGVVLDSTAMLGDIPVGGQATNASDELVLRTVRLPADSVVELAVVISAENYATTGYTSFGLAGVTAIAGPVRESGRLRFGPVRPLPLVNRGTVQYVLPAAGVVDLALFDAGGRRVRTLDQGWRQPGFFVAGLDGSGLATGVYFCRLSFDGPAGNITLTRKVPIAH